LCPLREEALMGDAGNKKTWSTAELALYDKMREQEQELFDWFDLVKRIMESLEPTRVLIDEAAGALYDLTKPSGVFYADPSSPSPERDRMRKFQDLERRLRKNIGCNCAEWELDEVNAEIPECPIHDKQAAETEKP
jgi:hypothetical protein